MLERPAVSRASSLHAYVGYDQVFIFETLPNCWTDGSWRSLLVRECTLPPEVTKNIANFDMYGSVLPFTFEL